MAESAWSPLSIRAFRALWLATLVSNIGGWFQEVAAGWLMLSLSTSPFMVTAVQAATTLPILLLGIPAGALADIVDRRRLLLAATLWMTAMATVMAGLQLAFGMKPWALLLFVFLVSVGTALSGPAWQAIVPDLVPKAHLGAAVALNGVGINIARAVGPALAGVLISRAGPAAAFVCNAVSFLGVVVVLLRWRSPRHAPALPSEQLLPAIAAGLRFVRHEPRFRGVLVRSASFAFFAVSVWSLLPLVARDVLGQDPAGYGMLLGAIGAGAVSGAIALPRVRLMLGPERLTLLATLVYAATAFALSRAPSFLIACALMALTGAAWIAMLSTLHVSAQVLLPAWVRARGLSVSLTVFFGSMALGAMTWGAIAQRIGVASTLAASTLALVVAWFASRRFRLPDGSGPDLASAKRWSAPDSVLPDERVEGPVLVLIEYQVAAMAKEAFHALETRLRSMRLRNGALTWCLYRDPERPNRYVETFVSESRLEHLRFHGRVTGEDAALLDHILELQQDRQAPVVRHLLAEPLPD